MRTPSTESDRYDARVAWAMASVLARAIGVASSLRSRSPGPGHMTLRGRILVVDDEASLRAVMAEALAAEGYEVSQAADGARALDLLPRERADAIVLDLTMPIVDGWAFLRETKTVGQGRIGIVAVSAVMDKQVAERLRELGVRYCLAKPFDIDELLACVARVLATARPDKASRARRQLSRAVLPALMPTHDPSAHLCRDES